MRVVGMLLSLILALALVACGGSGGSGTNLTSFEGQWRGNYEFYRTNGSLEFDGQMNLTTNAFGQITGTIQRNDVNETVQIAGSVQPGGSTSLTFTFTGFGSPRTASGACHVVSNRFEPQAQNQRLNTTNNSGNIGELRFSLARIN